jgi:multiple sugar transport system permease protein
MIRGLKVIWRERVTIGRYAVMTLLVPIFLCPIVFMLFSSLKPDYQLLRDSQSVRAFLPVGDLSLDNYRSAFRRAPVGRFVFNSILVASLTVILGLFVNSLAGFALVFLRWNGKDILLMLIVATFIVPFEAIVIPLLLIVSRFPWISLDGLTQGWQNTYLVQIIPFVANAFSIYLFVQFFKSLPVDFVEAARIDGASWFQVYRRVILPLSGPVITTVAILIFLPMWNQYLWPVMVIQIEAYRPVMVGFDYYQGWGETMAYLSTITIPVLVLFLALQNAFVESIASTGIRG